MNPLCAAVLGAGDWARHYHLPSMKILGKELPLEIAGIWNRTGEKAVEAARQFDIPRVYRSLQEAVEDERTDCFVVLVHSAAMREIVLKLLPRRLPIFTEKPPGASYAEAHELAGLVDLPNLVAFNRRYMPINRRFKAMAESIRDVYFAECHFYRNNRFYDHFILETGLHGINFMEYLCGPIRETRTQKLKNSSNGTSLWISSVDFESGAHGLFKFFPCCGSSLERYELHGSDASIYLHCPQTYTLDHPGKIIVHEKGKAASIIEDDPTEPLVSAGFLDEYREYFRAVRDGAPTTSNFRNAENTMRVAEAIEAADG